MTLGLLPLLVLVASPATPAADDHRAAMRKAADLLVKAEGNLNKLYFLRRKETREFDSSGRLKSRESVTVRREPYEEMAVIRVVERDDSPIPEEEARQQAEHFRAQLAAFREQASQEEPPKPAKRKQSDELQLIREFPDAMNFTRLGPESFQGKQGIAYEFSPRPGYSAKSMKARMFEKARGKCILDKASGELLLLDAEMFDDVGVAFGLAAKIGKGTKFRLVRTEAAPGIWVEKAMEAKLAARILLVKSLRKEIDTEYSEFRPHSPAPVSASASRP